MDLGGNGILVEQERLHLAMGIRPENFSFDKFRYMCILSGCDYLPSLPGIGLAKACKFISKASTEDIHKALTRLPMFLNMRKLPMDQKYRDDFMEADATFRYQLVYDPLKKSTVPLNPLPPGTKPVGTALQPDQAYQLALGNLNPFTLATMDSYDPTNSYVQGGKNSGWGQSAVASHPSIWCNGFKMRPPPPVPNPCDVDRPNTHGMEITKVVKLDIPKKVTVAEQPEVSLEDTDLLSLYGTSPSKKLSCLETLHEDQPVISTSKMQTCQQPTSPILGKRKRNPFTKKIGESPKKPALQLDKIASKTKFSALAKFSQMRNVSGNDHIKVQSRYFQKSESLISRTSFAADSSAKLMPEVDDKEFVKEGDVSLDSIIDMSSEDMRLPLKTLGSLVQLRESKHSVSKFSEPPNTSLMMLDLVQEVSEMTKEHCVSDSLSEKKVSNNSSFKNLLQAFKWNCTPNNVSKLQNSDGASSDFRSPLKVIDANEILDLEEMVDDPGSQADSGFESISNFSQQTSDTDDITLNSTITKIRSHVTPIKPVTIRNFSLTKSKTKRRVGLSKVSAVKRSESTMHQSRLGMFGFETKVKKFQHQTG